MENITANELSSLRGEGHRQLQLLEVGEFNFFIFADRDINAPYGKGQMFIHLGEKDSPFENTIDFSKQTKDADGMRKHIIMELKKLNKMISKL